MRLSLERLEHVFFNTSNSYHCDENDLPRSIGYLEKVGTGVDDAWPILYAAARNGGVELLDVLYCLRMSPQSINTLIEHILEPTDFVDVMLIVKNIQAEALMMQSINMYVLRDLSAWIAKTKMMHVVNRVRDDNASEA